jgi:hypothetical protein
LANSVEKPFAEEGAAPLSVDEPVGFPAPGAVGT